MAFPWEEEMEASAFFGRALQDHGSQVALFRGGKLCVHGPVCIGKGRAVAECGSGGFG